MTQWVRVNRDEWRGGEEILEINKEHDVKQFYKVYIYNLKKDIKGVKLFGKRSEALKFVKGYIQQH